MIKASVAYFTKTGHSREIAQGVGQALQLPVKTITDEPEPSELLFIVGGIYASRSDPKMLKAVRRLTNTQVRRAVLITSSASGQGQKEVRAALAEKGIRVAEQEFICRGRFLFFNRKHPDAQDIANAVTFMKETLEKYGGASKD